MFQCAVAEILRGDDSSIKVELDAVVEPVRPEMVILLSSLRSQLVEIDVVRVFLAPGMS